jgi:hypothetical protein
MIMNIVDRRKHTYRFQKIEAVVEDTWHDNSMWDADRVEEIDCCLVEYRNGISVQEAIRWAQEHEGQLTLFLYEEGQASRIVADEQ